ncbi:hypothetical protein H2248_001760 [Termitomyces sp. 'cryptogamus']|nr:hypothetical protein H2248_001760 [Termitomyces sp. 'cryptogamus']
MLPSPFDYVQPFPPARNNSVTIMCTSKALETQGGKARSFSMPLDCTFKLWRLFSMDRGPALPTTVDEDAAVSASSVMVDVRAGTRRGLKLGKVQVLTTFPLQNHHCHHRYLQCALVTSRLCRSGDLHNSLAVSIRIEEMLDIIRT